MKYSLSTIRSWNPCWDPGPKLSHSGKEEWSVVELWQYCESDVERIWVATRPGVLSLESARVWLINTVSRAFGRVVTPSASAIAIVTTIRSIEDANLLEVMTDAFRTAWHLCDEYLYLRSQYGFVTPCVQLAYAASNVQFAAVYAMRFAEDVRYCADVSAYAVKAATYETGKFSVSAGQREIQQQLTELQELLT